jgi:flagellar protein FliO/FliZ
MPRAPRPAEAVKPAPAPAERPLPSGERLLPSSERHSPSAAERVAAAPPPTTGADQNLADMAQRLEAALRRPAGEASEPRVGAPSVAPEPPSSRPARNEPAMTPPPVTPAKSSFENLEDEMASLLGRPKNSS